MIPKMRFLVNFTQDPLSPELHPIDYLTAPLTRAMGKRAMGKREIGKQE
jgi:hypothetical protein